VSTKMRYNITLPVPFKTTVPYFIRSVKRPEKTSIGDTVDTRRRIKSILSSRRILQTASRVRTALDVGVLVFAVRRRSIGRYVSRSEFVVETLRS